MSSELEQELRKAAEFNCQTFASRRQRDEAKRKKHGQHYDSPLLEPALREIDRKLRQSAIKQSLICPNCGKGDEGNALNGRPWCFKCNTILVEEKKVRKYLRGVRKWENETIRVLPKGSKEEITWLK